MIWLKVKQWFWTAMVYVFPPLDCPAGSRRYRFTLWVYENSYRADYDFYEAALPLTITPPGDDPF